MTLMATGALRAARGRLQDAPAAVRWPVTILLVYALFWPVVVVTVLAAPGALKSMLITSLIAGPVARTFRDRELTRATGWDRVTGRRTLHTALDGTPPTDPDDRAAPGRLSPAARRRHRRWF